MVKHEVILLAVCGHHFLVLALAAAVAVAVSAEDEEGDFPQEVPVAEV